MIPVSDMVVERSYCLHFQNLLYSLIYFIMKLLSVQIIRVKKKKYIFQSVYTSWQKGILHQINLRSKPSCSLLFMLGSQKYALDLGRKVSILLKWPLAQMTRAMKMCLDCQVPIQHLAVSFCPSPVDFDPRLIKALQFRLAPARIW